jgi:hypothetical protein
MNRVTHLCFVSLACLLLSSGHLAQAQTTAFTYQGRLTEAGSPANGNYDIRIQLYDAQTGGNVICGAQGSPNVSVVNGVFTLQLDFGSEACFPFGSNRYLEVAVRPTGSPNPHTILSPRQQILSVPYTLKSLKAQDANNATNAQLATNALSLGGFGASLYLRTNGDGSALTNLNAGGITSGTLSEARLSSNIARLDAANQTFTGNTFFGGNVGIGTSTPPQTKLTVQTPTNNYGLTHTDGTISLSSFVGPGQAGSPAGGWFGTQSNHPLHFYINNSQPSMTIDTFGRVKLGQTSLFLQPARLTVLGDFFTGVAVYGYSENGRAIFGESGVGTGYAGYFAGDVHVVGRFSTGLLIDGGSNHVCYVGNGTLSQCSSSLRYKKDLQPFAEGLSFIKQLRPISYRWKSSDAADVGFAAEDVEKIDPRFVTYNQEGEVEGVKYDRLSVVFVNAFKEQQQQINAQRTLLEQQQTLIKHQQRHIDALTKVICQLQPQAAICQEAKQ